jgi:hypothetical protein
MRLLVCLVLPACLCLLFAAAPPARPSAAQRQQLRQADDLLRQANAAKRTPAHVLAGDWR